MTSPYTLPTDSPVTLFVLSTLKTMGALFSDAPIIMAIPMSFMIIGVKQGRGRKGRTDRQYSGVMPGLGEAPHAHSAILLRNTFEDINNVCSLPSTRKL